MMIMSHGAAAVIATTAYASIAGRNDLLTPECLGKVFVLGVLPDVPLTLLVLSGKFDPSIHYHHTWITHTPIFWLVVSVLVAGIFSVQTGAFLLGATWLHLGMDWYGGADGIPFLYPFSRTQFGVLLSGINGASGLTVYFGNPYLLLPEIAVNGTFLAIVLLMLIGRLGSRPS